MWISVSERLPQDGESVLVYCSYTETQFTAMLWDGKWTACTDHVDTGCQNPVFDNFSTEDITDWQPLPEPPTN